MYFISTIAKNSCAVSAMRCACMPSFTPSPNCGPCLAAAAGASAGLKHEAGPGAHADHEIGRTACREPPPRDEELEDCSTASEDKSGAASPLPGLA
jgi:hypothetical protein